MKQWKEITSVEQWEQIWEQSKDNAFVVLKHSTQCPVSASALEEYEQYLAGKPNESVDFYMVKVIETRPVSNRISDDSGVKHASPQILYVKDKHPVWNTSHWSVTTKHISAVLD